MKQFYYLILLIMFAGIGSSEILLANNLQIGVPVLTDLNSVDGTVGVQFDISWDNSWRTTDEPNNFALRNCLHLN